MRKIMMLLAAMALIAFAYMSTSVFAEGMKDSVAKNERDLSVWIGAEVRNVGGDHLGTVKDFVWDSEGRLSFAIVSHGGLFGFFGSNVAIPFSALTYDKEQGLFTCAISEDRLAGAPEVKSKEELNNRSFSEEIYRYFGQHPYWTEETTEEIESQDH